ncbi:MAG: WecB/TagA/CpsF family glycosyltransferase [Bacillota bacterium]
MDILGVEFYPITFGGACRALDWMLSLNDGKTRLAVTGNPIMVMIARKDPEFARILSCADLLVPDGIGIIWAAKRAGRSLPERVTGVDLTNYLLSKKPSPRIFLLGGKPGVAERAKNRLIKDMPWVRIAGLHHGYFKEDEEEAVVRKVRFSEADVVLAGMGAPRQEKFLWRNRDALGAKLGMGVGGTLDILAGDVALTPLALRKAGLEWLHRLVRQPGRIKADVALFEFALRVMARTMFGKGRAPEGDQEDEDQGYYDARRE